VSITGPAGGIIGDIGIGPNGKLSITGDEFVTGMIFLDSGAKYSKSGGGAAPVPMSADLSMAISDAIAASQNLGGLMCDQTFANLKTQQTITATHAGLNVICVGNVALNGKTVTLDNGGFGAQFVLNVTGSFKLTGGGKILVGGTLQPSDVLYNVLGTTGGDVAFSGGGGGTGCCKAQVDGTLLAVNRKIALSPGLVNGGAVISGLDISIVSGSKVTCPLMCP
jgi:hypothetical protein